MKMGKQLLNVLRKTGYFLCDDSLISNPNYSLLNKEQQER